MRSFINETSFKIIGIAFVFISLLSTPVSAKIPSMAIFPLKIHSDIDLTYMQSAIMDMLASRLAAYGRLTIVDKGRIETVLASFPEGVGQDNLQQVSKQLEADYYLFGTLTELGNRIRIDLKLKHVLDREKIDAFFVHNEKFADLIPNLDVIADDILHKIFGDQGQLKSIAKKEPDPVPDQYDMYAHPEKLVPLAP